MNSRRQAAPPKLRRAKAGTNFRLDTSKDVEASQVRALFCAAGWTEDLARYTPTQIKKLLRNSHLVFTVWDGRKLVGLATAVSDGVLCGMVQNLLVHPAYRRRGLGTRLLRELARTLTRQRVPCLYALGTRHKRARAFFGRAGFRPLPWNVFVRLNR